jgi:hypothetical protein
VLVLAFGLAQRIWHDGAASSAIIPVTRPGMVPGTIAYIGRLLTNKPVC